MRSIPLRRLTPLLAAFVVAVLSCGRGGGASISSVGVGVATQLAFSTPPVATVAGAIIAPPIVVTAQDASGDPATSFTGAVTLAFGANPGASTLSGSLTAAAVAGLATFSNISLNHAGAGYTLTASSGALTPATSAAFSITGAAATMARSGGDLQSGPISAALATPLSVTITDASANLVPGVTVSWAAIAGGGSMGAPTSVTNALGVATMIWTLGATLGPQTATATVTGLTGSPATFGATATTAFTLASLAAGSYHTCGLTAGGAAYCWGSDSAGQLGDGTTTSRSTPTPVVGGLVFASLTAGISHTCGLTTAGAAYCWGDNVDGDVGDGTTTAHPTPTPVTGGPVFANLTAGFLYTCGLTTAGAAYCWGNNSNGELGDGTTTSHPTPTPVAGAFVFTSLTAAGSHTCGLIAGGAAYCWGYNQSGVLAVGTLTNPILTPKPVVGGLVFASLMPTSNFTCGLTTGGVAYCWGANEKGELGDGLGTYEATTPTKIASILVFASLWPGGDHNCGLTAGGVAYCWGDNDYGEVGNGTTGPNRGVTLPAPVAGGLVLASLAPGFFHTCGLTAAHAVYCWGYNFYGQVGDGTTTDRSVPTRVISP
jgi:alpha-tubulin suppressor-like RCC1 family protein